MGAGLAGRAAVRPGEKGERAGGGEREGVGEREGQGGGAGII